MVRDAILEDLVTADIELVETHISWVLLGRSEVWKREHLIVDTAQPLETSLAELRRAVRTCPAGLGS